MVLEVTEFVLPIQMVELGRCSGRPIRMLMDLLGPLCLTKEWFPAVKTKPRPRGAENFQRQMDP